MYAFSESDQNGYVRDCMLLRFAAVSEVIEIVFTG